MLYNVVSTGSIFNKMLPKKLSREDKMRGVFVSSKWAKDVCVISQGYL